MKKVVVMFLSILLLTGCMGSTKDNLKNFKDYNGKKESYELVGTMKLINNEDEFTYDIKVGVKDNNYYKVSLINTINNHEQVILKNDDGVYVVSPNLNKSFRFQSEWPNNSSQAYLLGSLVNDLNNDSKSTIKEEKDTYLLNAKVNYPNNPKMDNEEILTDKKFNVKKVIVKDEEGNPVLEVKVNDINYTPRFDNNYFSLDNYNIEEEKEETKKEENKETTETTKPKDETTTTKVTDENKNNKEEECIKACDDANDNNESCKSECKTQNTSNILDDIIYPLYVPNDTYLSSKDTVSTDNGNRVILTFAGTDPFILVEEASVKNAEMEVIPVSGEPLLIGASIGALTSNSIYWTNDGIDYYLTSNTLDSKEMMTIALSISNSSSLVAATK